MNAHVCCRLHLGIYYRRLLFGDWRHWKKYQGTMMYWIIGDLLYLILTKEKPLWSYTPTVIFKTGTMANIAVTILSYPAAALMYLSNFPEKSGGSWWKPFLYILGWVTLSSLIEWVNHTFFHEIKFENGWSMMYSISFYVAMFVMAWVHFRRPLVAYAISVFIAVGLMWMFQVPLPT